VVANDVSARSVAVGKALIENSRHTIADEDIALALEADASERWMPEVKKLPFPEEIRMLLAALCVAADGYHVEAKRELLRALMLKTAVRISMWGQVTSTAGKTVRDGDWDKLSAGQAKSLDPFFHPRRELLRQAAHLNAGVMDNGLRNEMHHGDVLDFLRAVEADVVYLDPPYPGTVAYEDQYGGLDELLANREIAVERSRFSASDGWKFLADVYDAAEHIPVWVLSLGNEAVELEPLVALMEERGRTVSAESLAYEHLASQATSEKNEGNREFIITATKQ